MYPEMIYSRFDTNADAGRISGGVFCTDTRDIHMFFSLSYLFVYIYLLHFFITWPPFKRKYIVSTSARGVKVLYAFPALHATKTQTHNMYLYCIIYLCIFYNIIICPMNILSDTDILCMHI